MEISSVPLETSGIGDFDLPSTSALQYEHPHDTITPFDDVHLAPRELTTKPGKTGNYSSTNFDILGFLLAAKSGAKGEFW